jgi:hypothetical protein
MRKGGKIFGFAGSGSTGKGSGGARDAC